MPNLKTFAVHNISTKSHTVGVGNLDASKVVVLFLLHPSYGSCACICINYVCAHHELETH